MRAQIGGGWSVAASMGIAVVLAACGPASSDSDGTSALPELSTTVMTDTSTTLAEPDTTLIDTTTSTVAGSVTVHPNLPSASSRKDIPWQDVGAGWYLVLYDSSRADPGGEDEDWEGPVALYLVDSEGSRYEVATWPVGEGPWWLVDVVGTSAVVAGNGATLDDTEWQMVDLATGDAVPVHAVSFPENTYGSGPAVSLTRPTGANVVVYESDGASEWLERRSVDGTVLATVFEQFYTDSEESLRWMYGHEGTSLFVTHRDGIAEQSNTGVHLGEVWVPADTRCEPVRWWDADTFLAACYGQTPESAPLDEDGFLHTHYGRLWLLEADGGVGAAMTEYPDEPPSVVDFGHHDGWPTGAETLIQWSGDCGASEVATLQPDGSGAFIPISASPSMFIDGVEMIDVADGEIAVYGWEGCGGWIGALFATDLDGGFLRDLLPVVGDARGVVGVRGFATVYP